MDTRFGLRPQSAAEFLDAAACVKSIGRHMTSDRPANSAAGIYVASALLGVTMAPR